MKYDMVQNMVSDNFQHFYTRSTQYDNHSAGPNATLFSLGSESTFLIPSNVFQKACE